MIFCPTQGTLSILVIYKLSRVIHRPSLGKKFLPNYYNNLEDDEIRYVMSVIRAERFILDTMYATEYRDIKLAFINANLNDIYYGVRDVLRVYKDDGYIINRSLLNLL